MGTTADNAEWAQAVRDLIMEAETIAAETNQLLQDARRIEVRPPYRVARRLSPGGARPGSGHRHHLFTAGGESR